MGHQERYVTLLPNIYGIRVRVIPKVMVRVRVIPKVRVRVGVIREVLMPGTSGMVLYIWYGIKHLVWLNESLKRGRAGNIWFDSVV